MFASYETNAEIKCSLKKDGFFSQALIFESGRDIVSRAKILQSA